MRDTGYYFSKEETKQKISQGGDKKVMKKSLSVVLAAALTFASFGSLASAADLTAQEKFNALKEKGIFAGMADGTAGLDQEMTRAQFARVLGLLAGLDVDAAPTTTTFTDVKASHWAYQEIEAAVAGKLLVGQGNGKFNPSGEITVQELAVALANVLGLEEVKDAKVEGAAAWAAGYIKALETAGVVLPTNYTEAATRELLVGASFTAAEKLNIIAPAKVSVVSAKATDVNQVSVSFDKAVDTAKATLTLKRGTSTVATTAVWADDKKSATLTLTGTKIADADYSVTLAGIAAEEIGTATASFKGEAEKVVKLEFVTASEEIALTTAARVKLRAENQYGKLASANGANYTVNAAAALGATITKDNEGYLVVKMNTVALAGTPGLSQIPIYVYSNDNHLTAFKTFKLGFAPFVTKSELSAVKYDNGKTALINAGDTATADIAIYDQYGNPMSVSQGAAPVFNNNVIPYAQDITVDTPADLDNDDEYEVRVVLNKKTDKAATHTLTMYVGSSSSTTTFEVGTSKVATTIEFEAYNNTLATKDTGKLVTFNAYDANGDKLTAQDIADNAKNGRFNLTFSGVTSASIVTVGPDKGKILLGEVTNPKNSFVFLTLSILSPNANTTKTVQIPVADVRVPASLAIDKKPHDKAVLGAESEFKIIAKDQYGDKIEGTDANYRIQYDFEAGATGTVLTGTNSALMMADGVTSNLTTAGEAYKFDTAPSLTGRASLKATLEQFKDGAWKPLANPVVVAIESIDPAKTELNYSIGNIDSLYASIDHGSLFPTGFDFTTSQTKKEISLTVKDNASNSVAYPANILDIKTSDNLVAQVVGNAGAKTAHVVGNKAGTATVTATVYKANGETAVLTSNITVKNDAVVADSLSSKGSVDLATPVVGSDLATLMEAKLKDNYGIEYTAAQVAGDYSKLVGMSYTVSEFTNVTVSVNPNTGVITAVNVTNPNNYQFVVTATAPNGKTTSTIFYHKA